MGYYADDVAAPRVAGAVAIVTVHACEASRDFEAGVTRGRADIGRVEVRGWVPGDGNPPSDAERMGLR